MIKKISEIFDQVVEWLESHDEMMKALHERLKKLETAQNENNVNSEVKP